jgi:hypothetical protein
MKQELENKLRQIGYLGKTDLETILEALPNEIFKYNNGVKTMSSEMLFITKSSLFYGYEARLLWTKKEPDESLVNCVARLLIKLIEEKIINLNRGENEKTTKENS